MPNESDPSLTTRKEMLTHCARSWEESEPPPNLRQELSLRFGRGTPSGRELPDPPMKAGSRQKWAEWLERVLEEFPLDPADVEHYQAVKAEPEEDGDKAALLQEAATTCIESHLAADPL